MCIGNTYVHMCGWWYNYTYVQGNMPVYTACALGGNGGEETGKLYYRKVLFSSVHFLMKVWEFPPALQPKHPLYFVTPK